MRDGKEIDYFDSAIGWSLVREDCALGLDGLSAALDTLGYERPEDDVQVQCRISVMNRLSAAIQLATQALEDIRNAEHVASGGQGPLQPLRSGPANPLGLTSNDIAILQCAAEGMVDKAIALQLNQDAGAIHQRWKRIRVLLSASDRSNAVCIAVTLSIIRPPSQTARLLQLERSQTDLN